MAELVELLGWFMIITAIALGVLFTIVAGGDDHEES